MSGSANEAQVVISTDYQTMKDFVEFTQGGFDKIKKKGKESFQEIGKEVFDFTKSVVGGQFVSAGNEIASAITAPLKKGLSEAIKDAESFRKVISGVAISTGRDAKAIGAEFDKLSSDTRRSIEEINGFIQGVKGQTGDRQRAVDAVQGVSKEARLRGVDNLGEMAGEVGVLQRRWGVSDMERFYNEQRAGAKAVGVNANQAMGLFGKMAPTLSNTGMSAEKAAQFSTSLLHMAGGDSEMALKAGQEFTSLVQDRAGRGYLEKTLGLKQGALLDDKFRPDVARALDLMQQFQKTKRGQKGLEYVARQHMSPTTAALFTRGMDTMRSDMATQQRVSAGTDLTEADKQYSSSDQGRADLAEQERLRKDREMGKDMLPWYDRAREQAGGWAGWAKGKAAGAFGVGGVLYGAKRLLWDSGAATGAAKGISKAVKTGVAGAVLQDMDIAGAERLHHHLKNREADPAYWQSRIDKKEQFQKESVFKKWDVGGLFSGDSASLADLKTQKAAAEKTKQEADMQGKATAEQLSRGAAIPVRITNMGMAPTVGQGAQK